MPDPIAHLPDQDEVELAAREKAGNLAEARTFAKEAGEDVDLGLATDEPEDLEAIAFDDELNAPAPDQHVEDQLDHALADTFPASDPVSIGMSSD